MKKYITREITNWNKDSVYMYDLSLGEETILTETTIFKTINKLNQEGFYLTAIDNKVYYLTKEIG